MGSSWQNTSWGKLLQLSPTVKLSFYPVSTSKTGSTIDIQIDDLIF